MKEDFELITTRIVTLPVPANILLYILRNVQVDTNIIYFKLILTKNVVQGNSRSRYEDVTVTKTVCVLNCK